MSPTSLNWGSRPRCGPAAVGRTIGAMQTNIHEIADGVYRLSTVVPEVAPGGFTFNQYLIDGDEPMLFHTGARQLFPLVSEAVGKVIDVERLRWISFGHVESDECGAMNQWLDAAPSGEVVVQPARLHGVAQRPVRPAAASPPIPTRHCDIGGHAVRTIPTPHVPHGWEAQVLFDETTRTLFCGDLFTQTGEAPAIVHDADLIQPALDAEDMFGATALTADTAPTHPPAGRPRAPYAGAHARPGLRRRLPPGAARPRRRLRGPLQLDRSLDLAGIGGRLMRQELTTDTVERYIEAPPEALYDLIADVTRTPERTPDIVRCEWLDGATGPAVGARFKAINKQGRGPNWSNKPVVTVADPGREFAFARTEPLRRHHRVALPVRRRGHRARG